MILSLMWRRSKLGPDIWGGGTLSTINRLNRSTRELLDQALELKDDTKTYFESCTANPKYLRHRQLLINSQDPALSQ